MSERHEVDFGGNTNFFLNRLSNDDGCGGRDDRGDDGCDNDDGGGDDNDDDDGGDTLLRRG